VGSHRRGRTRFAFADDLELRIAADHGPLFAGHAAKAALPPAAAAAIAVAEFNRPHTVAVLVPLALEIAELAGPQGLTVANVRLAAVQRGILPPGATGRELAFLGALMKRAGLRPTTEMRRSQVVASHGNLHRVWVHPSHALARGDILVGKSGRASHDPGGG
jgi:hypothetical protein